MTARPAPALHVHVKRLVVDRGALDGMSANSLHAQVTAALLQELGSGSAQVQVGALASHIGAAVTPVITGQLHAQAGRAAQGGKRHG